MASSRSSACPGSTKSKKIPCDYCTEERLEALKSCLDCGGSFCFTHLMPHNTAAKFKTHKLIDPVDSLEDYLCNKHKRPLELFCRDDQMCVCQLCTKGDHKTHNMVPLLEEAKVKKSHLGETQADVEKTVQNRVKKIQELKSSVELSKKSIEKEKADVVEIFSALMRCIERNQAELLKVMEEKQKAAERQAEEFIKYLQCDINELKRRNTELEQLSHTEDPIRFLQVETLQVALSQLQKSLNEEMEKVPEIKLKRMQQYAVDVTLDPDTGNSSLILSEDGKQVTHEDLRQKLPDSVKRFDPCPCILGKQGFSSGKFYYEVQVREKTKWDLGVAKESVSRKGEIKYGTEYGFWVLCLRNNTEYKACDTPPVSLSLKQAPQKVGVFVDYEEGLISFYNVHTKSLIYSFRGQTLIGKIYPFFSPSLNNGGKNSAPLVITPVQN